MKTNRAGNMMLKVLIVFVVVILLIGFSNLGPLKYFYFPFVNHLFPVGGELHNKIVISEVMPNPIGSEPGGEWIEIYNRSSESVDLQLYKIGDSEVRGDLEGMYIFPEGSHINPGQTILIANQSANFSQRYGFRPEFELSESDPEIPNLTKYRTWSGGVINLSNNGDEVLILNQEDKLLDAVSWGGSNFAFTPTIPKPDDGMSLERKPANVDTHRADDWSILPEPDPGNVNLSVSTSIPQTPTATQLVCDNNAVLISEVFYDPDISPEPDGEWMEMFNLSDSAIDLGCIILGDEETIGGAEGMMTFPPGSILSPGEVIVIANQATTFFQNYGFIVDFEINNLHEEVPDLVPYSQWATGKINLSNSGDELMLIMKNGQFIDAVSWGDSSYAFTPSVPIVVPGHSISRQPADSDSDSAEDWRELIEPNPGIVLFNYPSPSPTSETPSPKPPSPTSTSAPSLTPTVTPQPIPEIVINEILADPDDVLGDANNDGDVDYLDDEFIEIVNDSSSPVDISTWAVGDVFGIKHVFPAGSILEPNCGVVLFGGGNPTGNFGNMLTQVASSGKLNLNDQMETIYLYNTQLEVVVSLSYLEEARDDQSITRDPDLIGIPPLIKHSLAVGSNGTLFSPGTRINGVKFSGCPDL